MKKHFIKGKRVKREDPKKKIFLISLKKLEAEIVKLLKPFGIDDVGFTDEENMKLNVLFYQDRKEEPKFYHFSVFTFEGMVGVNFNDHLCWNLFAFPIEFIREVLKILKNKKKK